MSNQTATNKAHALDEIRTWEAAVSQKLVAARIAPGNSYDKRQTIRDLQISLRSWQDLGRLIEGEVATWAMAVDRVGSGCCYSAKGRVGDEFAVNRDPGTVLDLLSYLAHRQPAAGKPRR